MKLTVGNVYTFEVVDNDSGTVDEMYHGEILSFSDSGLYEIEFKMLMGFDKPVRKTKFILEYHQDTIDGHLASRDWRIVPHKKPVKLPEELFEV